MLDQALHVQQRRRRDVKHRGGRRRGGARRRRMQRRAGLRHPAAGAAPGLGRQQRRMLRAGIDGEGAAGARSGSPRARRARRAAGPRWSPGGGCRPRRPAAARRAAVPRCRDGADRSAAPAGRPSSTTSPAYITSTREQTLAMTPRSWLIRIDGGAQIGVQLAQQVEDLRLDRHVQRRGRLVGQEQRGLVANPHRQHHPLAHTAGELVRIDAEARSGAVMPMRPSSVTERWVRAARDRRRHAPSWSRPAAAPDAQDRVQRGHRVLEHHGDLGAADTAASPPRSAPARHGPGSGFVRRRCGAAPPAGA